MKHNKVKELLLRECPRCGKFVPGGYKECPECGAISASLQWVPVKTDDPEQADVLAANREIAMSYAARSADIVSKTFPGIKIPPKEDEEKAERKLRSYAVHFLYPVAAALFIVIGVVSEDTAIRVWCILLGIIVTVSALCYPIYFGRRDKSEKAPDNSGTYKAIIVGVGSEVVQYQQRFRRMKVLTDIDGRAVIVEVMVNYVPDEMCDTFYPIGREVTLVGKKDSFTVFLEN